MICKNCGKDNVAEALFCAGCGSKLEAEVQVEAPAAAAAEAVAPEVVPAAPVAAPAPEKPKKKGKAKLIIIIAIIVVLLAGIGVGGYFAYQHFFGETNDVVPPVVDDSKDKEAVEELVEEYIKAAQGYDIDKANEFLAEEDDNLFGGGAEEFKDEVYDECTTMGAVDFCYELIDKWAESRELTLKEVEKDDDKYICTVEIMQIDEEEMEDILWDALSEEEYLIEEIRTAAIEEGFITGEEEELDEEISDELDSRLLEKLNEMFEEDIEALEPVITETEIVVIDVDGEWKIDADESELY